MHNTPFPVGGKCVNPSLCQARSKRMVRRFSEEKTFEMLKKFLSKNNWREKVHFTIHAEERMLLRIINKPQAFETIEEGYPIPYENAFAVMWHVKTGKGTFQPIHVVFDIEGESLIVITLYNPKYSDYLYDELLETRICWCAKSDLNVPN